MYQYKLKILFKLTEANLAAKYDFSLRVIVQVESELFISYDIDRDVRDFFSDLY